MIKIIKVFNLINLGFSFSFSFSLFISCFVLFFSIFSFLLLSLILFEPLKLRTVFNLLLNISDFFIKGLLLDLLK